MQYLIRLAFNGRALYGTQKQPHSPSLQGEFEKALLIIYQKPVKVTICSRLDRFVSAEDYAVSFPVPEGGGISSSHLLYYLQRTLGEDFLLRSIEEKDDSFSARYSALYKIYRYTLQKDRNPIYNSISYCPEKEVDYDLFKEAVLSYQGLHDFKAFATPEKGENTLLSIDSVSFEEEKGLFYTRIQGKAFLRYQVRFLIGAALLVGTKEIDLSLLSRLLKGEDVFYPRHRAEPQGLVLEKIAYK